MPNWCYTDYKVFGKRESLEKLESIMKELENQEKPRVENGFGKLWLGCIIDYLGGNWQDINCRGYIIDHQLFDEELSFSTETAWGEMNEFREFLEKKIPDIKIYYMSEEPGMCDYYTNDKDGSVFHTRYYLDACDMDFEPEYFWDIQEVADYLNKTNLGIVFEPDEESIKQKLEEYREEHEDEYVELYKFEIE